MASYFCCGESSGEATGKLKASAVAPGATMAWPACVPDAIGCELEMSATTGALSCAGEPAFFEQLVSHILMRVAVTKTPRESRRMADLHIFREAREAPPYHVHDRPPGS